MNSTEFQQHFESFDPELTMELASRWFQLPNEGQFPAGERKGFIGTYSIPITREMSIYMEKRTRGVFELAAVGQYPEALSLIDERLVDIQRQFRGNDLLSANRYTLHERGVVQTLLAIYGPTGVPYSGLPAGPMRTGCFLSAARDFMFSDLEVGCATRICGTEIAKCFDEARLSELRAKALFKILKGRGEILLVNMNNTVDKVIVEDLIRRSALWVQIYESVHKDQPEVVNFLRNEYPYLNPRLN